ncbi:MAG TPA: Rieske 2Fe-2S domain-containing protein [Dehalococcoidia bacterium]|nr:Rieske 2Fe-2S domain-containing protein [Dehalococcoidia bacterium]
MLTPQDNETLTRVGPGTLMGNLLRRYWQPALLSSEVPEPDSPPIRVRLLGEDLIAFRDTKGEVGLVANACPHRGASLFFGRNEEAGLRCVYHGWKFDVTGTCVDMPSEPAESNFKNKVRAGAYPTHESGGVIWTYMGPAEKMQAFRPIVSEDLPREQWKAMKVKGLCNWVQGLEGNVDAAHTSWLHRRLEFATFQPDETDKPGYPSLNMTFLIWAFDGGPVLETHDTWYGFRYAGLRNTPGGHTHARVTDFIMPSLTYIPIAPVGGNDCIVMVPIDDNTHWRYHISTKPAVRMTDGTLQVIPGNRPGGIMDRTWTPENDYNIDRADQRVNNYTGISGGAIPQDQAVTESMGTIYDRTAEHLGTSDRAIIRMRRMLIEAARKLAQGIDPPAVDPSLNYNEFRSAEKILALGEDWRKLGTLEDPVVEQLQPLLAGQRPFR